MGLPEGRPVGLLALLLVLAVFASFAPALRAGFVNFDDDVNLASNDGFRGLDRERLEWMLRTSHLGPYQPLSWLSLAVDHQVHGLSDDLREAPAYHRTNVALHALGALAVAWAAWRLLGRALPGAPPGRLRAAAWLSAALFALHPLRVESVAWVTERRDVLCGLFFALAVGCWLSWRGAREDGPSPPRAAFGAALVASALAVLLFGLSVDTSEAAALGWGRLGAPGLVGAALALTVAAVAGWSAGGRGRPVPYALALLCFLAALASKGLALVLPALLLVVDLWPLRRRSLAMLAEKLPLFALAAIFGRLALWGQAGQLGTLKSWSQHGPLERLTQAAFGLAFYPWKTLAPFGLTPIHDLPDELSLLDPRFAAGLVAAAALTGAAFALRRRLPGVSATWAAFALSIAPVLGLTQSGPQLVAERYSYLACLPFAVLAGAWFSSTPRRVAAGLAVALLLGGLTFRQSRVWQSSEALWSHALAVDPASPMAHLGLGAVRMQQAKDELEPDLRRVLLAQALEHFEISQGLQASPRALANLSKAHTELGGLAAKPAERAKHDRAALASSRTALALAIRRGEFLPEYRLGLATDLYNLGFRDEALGHLEWYVGARPLDARGYANLGAVLADLGRTPEAVAALERALELAPADRGTWQRLAQAYATAGRSEDAQRARERAQRP